MGLLGGSWLDEPRRLAFVLLVPTLLLVFGVLLYPIAHTFVLGLTDTHLSRPDSGNFVGVQNFVRAAQDPEFRAAMGRTFYFALVTVPVETALGLAMALLLNQPFRGRAFVRGLVILPSRRVSSWSRATDSCKSGTTRSRTVLSSPSGDSSSTVARDKAGDATTGVAKRKRARAGAETAR
jgi:hypothetical protein